MDVLLKIKENESPSVCMLCWEKKEKALLECIILTKDYNPSNCKTHIGNQHKDEVIPGLFPEETTLAANTNLVAGSKVSKQSSLLFFQQNIGYIATPQIAHSFLYNFFNECNIAIQQANNSHLISFIDYLLENASQLSSKKKQCHFSRHKYMKQRDERFSKFIYSLTELVTYSRDYYKTQLSKSIPFLCVSHDGWDSIDHDILGVSLHFIVPGHWNVINVAVGLKRIHSKKSVETSDVILSILKRYAMKKHSFVIIIPYSLLFF